MTMRHRHDRPYTLPTVREGLDPSERYRTYGPVRPMEDKPRFLRRLLGW